MAQGAAVAAELCGCGMSDGSVIKRAVVEFPARLGLTRLWRTLRPDGIPVLTFHGVLPEADARLFNATGKFITPERLHALLTRLARLYEPVPLDAMVDTMLEGRGLRNRFALTFDDGYANLYTEAFPLLRKMGIPFAVFVTTGFIDTKMVLWNDLLEFAVFSTAKTVLPGDVPGGPLDLTSPAARVAAVIGLKAGLKRLGLEEAHRRVEHLCEALDVATDAPELELVRFLSADEISTMSQAGTVLGGHTLTHPILSRESRERVREEVTGCKRYLEAITDRPVTTFAYPNGQVGDFNTMVKDEVRAAGYRAAFTGIRGLARPGGDPLELKRLFVDCRWTEEEFETRASGLMELLGR